MIGPNPSGLCMCGCGQRTTIAPVSRTALGHVRGKPIRYIVGHAMRGVTHTAEVRAQISRGLRGRPPELCPGWKGGRYIKHGRTIVYVGRDHPMADKGGYVLEYRLVMSEAIGRPLTAKELVHHIDLDSTNDSLVNLAIVSKSQHSRIHGLIRGGLDPHEALAKIMAAKA